MQTKRNTRTRGGARQGLTLVEVLVAVAIGAVVIGGTMMLYFQGNRQFYKTTEHVSFRAEAMLCLEHIAKDLEQLMVSTDKNPGGAWALLEPYKFLYGVTVEVEDPTTGAKIQVPGGRGIEFYKFHHIEAGEALEGGEVMPVMVGQKISYMRTPIDPSDEKKGYNLVRNGRILNKAPLADFLFKKEPPVVASNQVQGSPHAILTVSVIPAGGMFGHMGTTDATIRQQIIDNLRNQGNLVSRTFHLIGYESMYTAMLYRALQRVSRYTQKNPGGGVAGANLSQLEMALYQDAYSGGAPEGLLKGITDGLARRAPPTFEIPRAVFKLEDKPYEEKGIAKDDGWLKSEVFAAPVPSLAELGAAGTEAGVGGGSGGSGGSSGSRAGSGSN